MREQRIAVAVIVALATFTASTSPSHAGTDRREIQARAHFAAGRYQDAVELFAQLYAEFGEPLYLRNIGRCYQKLERPDEAIRSFRTYLEKAILGERERAEIQRYIAEMEQLKAAQAPATPPPVEARPAAPRELPAPPPPVQLPAPPPPVQLPAPPPPAPVAAPAPVPAPAPALAPSVPAPLPPAPLSITVVAPQPAPAAEPSAPFYARWWFWTGAGALVAAGVLTFLLLPRGTEDPVVGRSNPGVVVVR